jgi:hypothetical protein
MRLLATGRPYAMDRERVAPRSSALYRDREEGSQDVPRETSQE